MLTLKSPNSCTHRWYMPHISVIFFGWNSATVATSLRPKNPSKPRCLLKNMSFLKSSIWHPDIIWNDTIYIVFENIFEILISKSYDNKAIIESFFSFFIIMSQQFLSCHVKCDAVMHQLWQIEQKHQKACVAFQHLEVHSKNMASLCKSHISHISMYMCLAWNSEISLL